MKGLEGLGTQEKADISEYWKGKEAEGNQALVDKGMTNTSISTNLPQGYGRAMQGDLSRVNERLQQQRLGYQTGLSQDILSAQERLRGNRLGFIERREDQYPDLNQMMQLAQGLGYTQNEMSGGYGGNGSRSSYSSGNRSRSSGGGGTQYKSYTIGASKGTIPFGGSSYARRNEPRRTAFTNSFASRLNPKSSSSKLKSASSPTWFDSSKYR
jgi:hypothetical protein